MGDLWAIANKMIQEATRLRIFLIIFFFILFFIPALPFILKSDGTLQGKIQLVLSYSIFLACTLLCLQSVFLSTYSFTNEIKTKQFFLVDAKFSQRWKFFIGKFIGLMFVNGFIVIVLASVILSGVYIGYKQGNKEEKELLQKRFFVAFRKAFPNADISEEKLQMLVKKQRKLLDKYLKKIQKKEKLSMAEIDVELRRGILQNLRRVQREKTWTFENIPSLGSIASKSILKLRYKLYPSEASFECKAVWKIGDGPNKFIHTNDKVRIGEFYEISIPPDVVDKGTLKVTFINKNSGKMYFPLNGVELLYPVSSFMVNYLKLFLLIYIAISFLVLLGLFASTFMSFPVAIFFCLFILGLAAAADFLIEFVPAGMEYMLRQRDNIWAELIRGFLSFLFSVVPDFSNYIPIKRVSMGIAIPWHLVAESFGLLLLVRGGIFAFVGCFIFRYREVGRPIL